MKLAVASGRNVRDRLFMRFSHEVISKKYHDLGYSCGWSFLACQEARLYDADVAFVGLNPAGFEGHVYQEIWSLPENAFCTEESYIKEQVQHWHRVLNRGHEETLCAQFVPFRSPDWKSLKHKRHAVPFARELWSWVLQVSPAQLFVTMGDTPAWHLVDLLGGSPSHQGLPTGWKGQAIDAWTSPSGRRVIRMPHPSWYPLFGRSGEGSDVAETMLDLAAELKTKRRRTPS